MKKRNKTLFYPLHLLFFFSSGRVSFSRRWKGKGEQNNITCFHNFYFQRDLLSGFSVIHKALDTAHKITCIQRGGKKIKIMVLQCNLPSAHALLLFIQVWKGRFVLTAQCCNPPLDKSKEILWISTYRNPPKYTF